MTDRKFLSIGQFGIKEADRITFMGKEGERKMQMQIDRDGRRFVVTVSGADARGLRLAVAPEYRDTDALAYGRRQVEGRIHYGAIDLSPAPIINGSKIVSLPLTREQLDFFKSERARLEGDVKAARERIYSLETPAAARETLMAIHILLDSDSLPETLIYANPVGDKLVINLKQEVDYAEFYGRWCDRAERIHREEKRVDNEKSRNLRIAYLNMPDGHHHKKGLFDIICNEKETPNSFRERAKRIPAPIVAWQVWTHHHVTSLLPRSHWGWNWRLDREFYMLREAQERLAWLRSKDGWWEKNAEVRLCCKEALTQ